METDSSRSFPCEETEGSIGLGDEFDGSLLLLLLSPFNAPGDANGDDDWVMARGGMAGLVGDA